MFERVPRATATLTFLVIASLSCASPATPVTPLNAETSGTSGTTGTTGTNSTSAPSATSPVDAKSAAHAGWDGQYSAVDAGVYADSDFVCPIGTTLTITGGTISFVVTVSPVDTTVEDGTAPTVVNVVATLKEDGTFDQQIRLPDQVVAKMKSHKGKLAAMSGAHVVGRLSYVDSPTEGTGKIGSVLVGALGLPAADATACGFGLQREDYKSPPPDPNAVTQQAGGGFNRCREAGAECNGNSNCCSGKCEGKLGHTQCI